MRKTEVWREFTEEEQHIIRKALRTPAARRTGPQKSWLREYWRMHKRRTRDRLPALDNHRINLEYRTWLRKHGLPEKFDRKTYYQFRRTHGSCNY